MKLKNYTQISTKRGDQGTSKNYSNVELSKDDVLFETLGTIDELSSLLGVIYHYVKYKEEIKTIQRMLQTINSIVATTDIKRLEEIEKVKETDISFIEQLEQSLLSNVSIERMFVLPGSETTKENAYVHLGRTVARRAERSLVRYIKLSERTDLYQALAYINRLSDLLFIIANE
jgi:cob(I)alamin adenosyltransferase